MIAKKDLLQAVQALLQLEDDMLSLCQRQSDNPAFLSGIPPQNRADVHAGFVAFLARSQQNKLTLKNLMGAILSGGSDVY
jgi:hypothetical protein